MYVQRVIFTAQRICTEAKVASFNDDEKERGGNDKGREVSSDNAHRVNWAFEPWWCRRSSRRLCGAVAGGVCATDSI